MEVRIDSEIVAYQTIKRDVKFQKETEVNVMAEEFTHYNLLINLSKVKLNEGVLKELTEKVSLILKGKSVDGMEIPNIADSTTVDAVFVQHTHDWD